MLWELQGVAQQKCLAHLIRNAADVAQLHYPPGG
jgi:hypothetical protein